MWVVPAAFLLTTMPATTATPNAVHLGLGAEQLQVRDEIVAPLRYQGTGARLDLAYTREAGRTSHRFDIVLSGAPALDRYGHRALGLRLGAGYEGLFPVARSPRYGSWLVGGKLDWNMALQYYAQWDEEHLYWLTTYDLAPAVAHDVRLAARHRLTTVLSVAAVSLRSRPPRQRFYKVDNLPNVGYWFTKAHEHARFASIPEYLALVLRVTHSLRLASRWGFETTYAIEYRREADPLPVQLLVQSITDSLRYDF